MYCPKLFWSNQFKFFFSNKLSDTYFCCKLNSPHCQMTFLGLVSYGLVWPNLKLVRPKDLHFISNTDCMYSSYVYHFSVYWLWAFGFYITGVAQSTPQLSTLTPVPVSTDSTTLKYQQQPGGDTPLRLRYFSVSRGSKRWCTQLTGQYFKRQSDIFKIVFVNRLHIE